MKLSEMREKSIEELQGVLVDFKKQLFDLRVQKATHKLENTALISNTKKLIAEAKTILKEKSLQTK
jgi:large subunit ribosomal protein L29